MHLGFVNPQGNFDPADSYWTAHPDFGGQLVYVKEVALALGQQGHRVDILTRQIVDPNWPQFAEAEDAYPDAPNVRILRFPCGPQGFVAKEDLWPYLAEWTGNIAAFYDREGAWPDLFTGHYADGGVACALLQERGGVPFTFTGHSLGAQKLDRLLESKDAAQAIADVDEDAGRRTRLRQLDERYRFALRLAAERTAMNWAGAIITNSGQEREEQYRHPQYAGAVRVDDNNRFAVIPPGVNLRIFDRSTHSPREGQIQDTVLQRWQRDIAPDRQHLPAVIASMRLDPKKNHIGLIRAFAASPELRAAANVLMIIRGSDDPLRDMSGLSAEEQALLGAVRDEIEAADLWGSVSSFSLAGQDAIAALYRWASAQHSVFCLPALYEPFGLAVVEAMAAGLPVVATSFGGPQEISAGETACLLADPTDPQALAGQLLRLISDDALWQQYHAAGYQRVLERYTWDRTGAAYADTGQQILDGARQGEQTLPIPPYIADPEHNEAPTLEG
jgi:sucrose-phosphate synthase